MSILDPATGKPRRLARQCATCVGRPGNPMHLRPGRLRELINGNIGDGRMGLICHETIDYGDDGEPGGGQQAICAWFYEKFGHLSGGIRVMERIGGFIETDPPDPPAP